MAETIKLAGADGLLERAQQAHDLGDNQLALELAAVVLAGEPRHARANRVKASACRALIALSTSANEKNFYLSGALIAEELGK